MEDHRRLYHWLKDANLKYTLDESQHLKKHFVSTMASGIRGEIHGVLLELHTDFPLTFNLHHYAQLIAADIEERSAIKLALKYYYSNEKDRFCLIIVPYVTDHGSRHYRGRRYQLKDASGRDETPLTKKYVNHARREEKAAETKMTKTTNTITEEEINEFHADLKNADLDEIFSDSGTSDSNEIVVEPVQQDKRQQGESEITQFDGKKI